MKLTNWKFALFYGGFFLVRGCYNVVEQKNVGVAFGVVEVGVGACALGLSARTWRRERIRKRLQSPQ